MGNLFKIAHITAAHGIRGEVKLACFIENPDDIVRYAPLQTKQGKIFTFRITGHSKAHLIIAIDGITDRNEAEMLRGTELFADASKLPAKNAEEYFVHELIGLTARLADGRIIGNVTALYNYGAGDILAIDSGDEEILLPFQPPFIGAITHDAITVQLPEYIDGEEAIPSKQP